MKKPLLLLSILCKTLIATAGIVNDPVIFVSNKGQIVDEEGNTRPDLLFSSDIGQVKAYFSKKGISYVFSRYKKVETPDMLIPIHDELDGQYRMDLIFEGSNPDVKILAEEPSGQSFNFYYPHCPNGITKVESFKRLTYRNLYPGIDLVYYTSEKQGFKYDLVVYPGADPSVIRFSYKGADQVKILNNGNLSIVNPLGSLLEMSPYSYQSRNDKYQKIASGFKISNNTISFYLGEYSASGVLVIDPVTKVYATYMGGNENEQFYDLVIDSVGNSYITGVSGSTNFPVTIGAYQSSNIGSPLNDIVLVKRAPDKSIIWSTYYGGSGSEFCHQMVLTRINTIGLIGQTPGANFPVSSSPYQPTSAGSSDGIIMSFDTSGQRLWATFMGGFNADALRGITSDEHGNYYVYGDSKSTDFPVTGNILQFNNSGGSDIVYAKFSNNGDLLWSTYYGGSADENPSGNFEGGIILKSGYLYSTGVSVSSDFPTTSGSFQPTSSGNYEGFILKLDTAGNRIWSTMFGGSDIDFAYDIVADERENVYITGQTRSTDFPITLGAFQSVQSGPAGIADAYISKLDSSGQLKWSTFYGSTGGDIGYTLHFDNYGFLWVGGTTASTSFPQSGSMQTNFGGGTSDAFILKFDTTGKRKWATIYGGNDVDYIYSISSTTGKNHIEACGSTKSTNLSLTSNAFQSSLAGTTTFDGFILSLDCFAASVISPSGNLTICSGDSIRLTGTGTATSTFKWSTGNTIKSIYVKSAGNYSLNITDTFGCTTDAQPVNISVKNNPAITISSSGPLFLCEGDSVVLSAPSGFPVYMWSNGDSLASIKVKTSGNYWVKVTDSTGCFGYDTVAVTVFPKPSPFISFASPLAFCQGDSVLLQAPAAMVSYTWNGITSSPDLLVKTSGIYHLLVTDTNSCSFIDSARVTSNSLPVVIINLSGPISFCYGDSVTLDAGSFNSYNWSSGENARSLKTKQSGSYTVQVIDSNGCADSSNTVLVKVNPLPTPIIQAAGPITFCQGDSVTLQTTSGYSAYNWNPGLNDFLIVKQSGMYEVSVIDSNSCKATSNKVQVNVNPNPVVNISVLSNAPYCAGDSIELRASGNYTFLWNNNMQGPLIRVNQTGNYSVSATDSNACISTAFHYLYINPAPAIPIISKSGDTLFTTSFAAYQWYLRSSIIPGATNQWYVPPIHDTFYVEVIDSSGCSSLSNGFGFTSTNIYDEQKPNEITIYPNPSSGSFAINRQLTNSPARVKVINTIGQTVFEKEWIIGEIELDINIPYAAPGVYFITISKDTVFLIRKIAIY